jgi:hypothetical protein
MLDEEPQFGLVPSARTAPYPARGRTLVYLGDPLDADSRHSYHPLNAHGVLSCDERSFMTTTRRVFGGGYRRGGGIEYGTRTRP